MLVFLLQFNLSMFNPCPQTEIAFRYFVLLEFVSLGPLDFFFFLTFLEYLDYSPVLLSPDIPYLSFAW